MKYYKEQTCCRKCKHPYNYHCLYVHIQHGGMTQPFIKPLEIVPCSGTDYMHGNPCGCMDFEPIDNLEYLEWKSELQDKHGSAIDDTTTW